ncbi:MAG: DUF1579 domain-containing protein, partial [candidate division KSB1 bacterium]|nr:DUF1579 domain-containing protein [candidate division KSB1 bacterium]
MKYVEICLGIIAMMLALPIIAVAQDSSAIKTITRERTHMTPQELFQSLTGRWAGPCSTWFEPGKLADVSQVTGEFRPLLDGRFLRHTYEGKIQGQPRHGEEIIAWNSVTRQFQISWVDDFHMNYAIMFSTGDATERGFAVTGKYDVAPNISPWGWKTVYELIDSDHL